VRITNAVVTVTVTGVMVRFEMSTTPCPEKKRPQFFFCRPMTLTNIDTVS